MYVKVRDNIKQAEWSYLWCSDTQWWNYCLESWLPRQLPTVLVSTLYLTERLSHLYLVAVSLLAYFYIFCSNLSLHLHDWLSFANEVMFLLSLTYLPLFDVRNHSVDELDISSVKTKNTWQSPAYNLFSAIVSQIIMLTYWSLPCLAASPPTEHTGSQPIKIFNIDCTTSYVLNSRVTEPNLTKFQKWLHCRLLLWNQNCDLPIRFRMPTWQIKIVFKLRPNCGKNCIFDYRTTS